MFHVGRLCENCFDLAFCLSVLRCAVQECVELCHHAPYTSTWHDVWLSAKLELTFTVTILTHGSEITKSKFVNYINACR
jgi:hypothetical protein